MTTWSHARALALAAAAALLPLAASATAPLAASDLLVEYMKDPIVLDIAAPRFYWLPVSDDRGVGQQSYRIVVNSTAGTTVWDSGVVASSASAHVVYAGSTALVSDAVYTWQVQWTDTNGAVAPWSATARFGTGFLTQQEWAPAAWIGCPLHTGSAPNYAQIRGEANLGLAAGVTITQARMYITAVGYYNLRVNGQWAPRWSDEASPGVEKFTRPRLDPGWTTYEVRSLYNAYDVTEVLSASGPNAIAITLGNGWPDISPVPGNSSGAAEAEAPSPHSGLVRPLRENEGGNRQTRFQLVVHTSDGQTITVASTAASFSSSSSSSSTSSAPVQWMCGEGALQYDNIYNGCTYDATQETVGWDLPGYSYASSGNWTAAVLRADPGGAKPTTMTAQTFPAVTLQLEVPAQNMWSPSPNVYVVDFGQNLAGVVRLALPAPVPAGATITMRHGEALMHEPYGAPTGDIYTGNLRSAKATDVYTTAGTEDGYEVFEPIFTYHGFRYLEISGLPFPPTLDMFTALYTRTGVDHAGNVAFPPSADVLNKLQHAVTWGIGCNLMSVVSDCPQRDERKGWMGDSGLSLQPTHYNYAIGPLYTFWAQNIRDSQLWAGDSHPVGSVPDTVPHTFGSYPSDPAWGTAYPGVVYSTWRMLGDTRIAADHYPNLQLYIDFMTQETNKSGVSKIYQSYGDWCPPGPAPPKSYTSGVAFIVDMNRIIELATALGKTQDAQAYSNYLNNFLIPGFNAAWLNATKGTYGYTNGDALQTANAAAIFIGAAKAAGTNALTNVANALVNDVVTTHTGHFSTGIIGIRYLHSALVQVGAGEAAVDTLLQTDYPSFGFEFYHPQEPATTLWELLDGPSQGPGMNSRNHHMFASPGGFLFEDLAGITQVRSWSSAYDPTNPAQVGFRHAVLFPRVPTHPNVSYVEAEYQSIAGRFAVTWVNTNASGPSNAGQCADQAPENTEYTFSCPPGGSTISEILFASFGTASGSCESGFTLGSCNAANSTAILEQACLNKTTCTISVADSEFGDPCYDTVKWLDAQVLCTAVSGVSVQATVPTNAAATVRIPLLPGTSPAAVSIAEGGSIVWKNGAFVPGVPGVVSASAGQNDDTPVGMETVDIEVLSGTYSFSTMAA